MQDRNRGQQLAAGVPAIGVRPSHVRLAVPGPPEAHLCLGATTVVKPKTAVLMPQIHCLKGVRTKEAGGRILDLANAQSLSSRQGCDCLPETAATWRRSGAMACRMLARSQCCLQANLAMSTPSSPTAAWGKVCYPYKLDVILSSVDPGIAGLRQSSWHCSCAA